MSSVELGTPDFIQHNRVIPSPFMLRKPLPFTGMSSSTQGEIAPQSQTDGSSKLIIQRNSTKKLPHLPKRRLGLMQFRMLQINLDIIKRTVTSSDLSHLIPTVVLLPPAVQVPEPDIAMVHECCTDWSVRAQYDGCHMLLTPWTSRVYFFDGEIPFPAAQVQKTIVRHAPTYVLKLRVNSEDIP